MKTLSILARLWMAGTVLIMCGACANMKKGGDEDWPEGEYGYDGDNVDVTPLSDRDGSYSYFGPGSSRVGKGQFSPVMFGFDRYDIQSSEVPKIQQVAGAVKGTGQQVVVAGFTDAVGTAEYNRVLGERRALAVRGALLQMGVSASKVQTVSFGEDMPADASNPNSGRNRRAEFGVVK